MLEGLKRGYAVVAINYRLSGEARFPALVHDAKAAVRWIRANAQRYHFDPDRIAAWGGSAGGYWPRCWEPPRGSELEDLSLGNPDRPSHVQAVVAWFGPTDFLAMDEQLADSGLPSPPGMEHNGANSPESLLLGQKITDIPERVGQPTLRPTYGRMLPRFCYSTGPRMPWCRFSSRSTLRPG